MATPVYEQIFDKVAEILKGIKKASGYATDLEAEAVTRRMIFLQDAIDRGLFPCISVVRRPGAAGRREGQAGQYYCTLPIWCVCYFRCDQSAGEVPDTAMNLLQNDIQRCVYENAAELRTAGAIDAGFPEEPEIAIEPGDGGLVYTAMFYTVEIGFLLPRKGF
jgi:hypothetical protein